MQRPIKFRAWDKNYKEMMFWGIGDIYGDGSSCTFPSGNLINMPQMQYTGLKDKNGVEIYEGDILDYSGTEQREVIFKDGAGAFGINTVEYENSRHLKFHPLFWLDIRMWKVIGNIYENKDLLS